jgi:hypothetical protein
MNLLSDICELDDLINVVVGYVDIVRLNMHDIVWYDRYRGLTPVQWKEIYVKRYCDFTFEFVVTYQDKFNEFVSAFMSDIMKSFTVCVGNFRMLRKKNRTQWICHCLMHPGIKLQDIPCGFVYTAYGLLTLEDKYWLYRKYGDKFVATAERKIMGYLDSIPDGEQKLRYIREIDYIRMVKDDKLDFEQLLNLYDNGSFIYVVSMAPLIMKRYSREISEYSNHRLIRNLKIDNWRFSL